MTQTCLISPQQNGSSSTPGPSSTQKNSNKRSTLLCRTTTSVKKRWGCFFLFEPRTHQRSHNFHLGLFCLQEAEREKQEAEKQQDDEEGWIKVTRGHKGAKARPHSEAANQRVLQREKKKKMRKELLNFYAWQHKKTQKERKFYFSACLRARWCPIRLEPEDVFIFTDIAELRKKFEEDKQKIALMRAQRKFRPYWINFFFFAFQFHCSPPAFL